MAKEKGRSEREKECSRRLKGEETSRVKRGGKQTEDD